MSVKTAMPAVAKEICQDSKITLKSCAPRDDKKGIIYTATITGGRPSLENHSCKEPVVDSARKHFLQLCMIVGLAVFPLCAFAQDDLPTALHLQAEEKLLLQEIPSVYGASKYEQKVTEAPASVSIVTAGKPQEIDMLSRHSDHHPIQDLDQVVALEELVEAQQAIRQVYVDDLVKAYIVDLVTTTRDHPDVYLGASPRGSLALFMASRALAALEGKDYVVPDHIKALAEPTLAHRLIISPSARIKNVTPRQIIDDALKHTPVPGARVKVR
jgi:hypothetical protein